MKKSILRVCASAFAVAAASAFAVPALAQDAPVADEADTGDLNQIVVTASGKDKTQLNTSISVTSVAAETIENFKPSSEAEIFRMIPGIQVAGTAGPAGNSNIAVRGLPVATGGSPFVQIQEDGLPTVLFGDIQFGNNDYWTHFDASVANVEGVRGGSASTYASQAPGAVINYISHYGKKDGGYIQLNKGINYDENKVDLRYGGHITDSLYFHVGGYFKVGRGPLHSGYNVSDSYQIKANITKEFDDGKGYFRMLFKRADTQEPNYTGGVATATLSGGKVSNIRPLANYDGRRQSNISIFNRDMTVVGYDGTVSKQPLDGITTKATSIQNQFHYEFDDAITVDNNARWTDMSGAFANAFLNVAKASGVIGSTVNGGTVAEIRYANGPKAGQLYTGAYVNNNANFQTNIRDIGSFANDLALSGKFDMAGGKLTARAGLFYMNQKIAMDWHVNPALGEISGNNPARLDLYTAAGAKLTVDGISGYNNNWGDCCARSYDYSYSDTAPYAALDLDTDHFGIDASVRFDNVKASGTGINNTLMSDTNGDGIYDTTASGPVFNTPVTTTNAVTGGTVVVNIPTIGLGGTQEVFDYSRHYTSWSIGGLYKVSPNTSLFVRASRGGRFNGDRQTFSQKFKTDGSLAPAGVSPSVDFVNQYEAGIKTRGDLAGGRFSAELTLLKGNFKQSTFELSATKCGGAAGGCIIDAKYKSYGAEFYGTYQNGGLSLVANATFSKATRAASGSNTYSRSPNIPDFIYTVSANYDFGDLASFGVNASGQTNTLGDDGYVYPGSTTFGAVLRVRPIENLELGVQAYNLFNKYDLRGAGNVADAAAGVIGSGVTIGRTFTASVRYSF
ncbi:TonB-dependent receptor [Novosphingobium aquiterrae]|uniref:TonB-dependent receptor n=1 Tax=Novosphingobium aquiterrae TaxID=624388 RepID=A0ABV6PGW2_9SPHN